MSDPYDAGYAAALCLALGVDSLPYCYSGSYEGYWIVQVGPDKYVWGHYGSCCVCDDLQAAEYHYSFDLDDTAWREYLKEYGQKCLDQFDGGRTRADLLKGEFDEECWTDARGIRAWLLEAPHE